MAQKFDHKKAFQKNRVRIVRDLANPDNVADELYNSKIFTDEMTARVHQENEKEKKNRLILDTLTYRGKKAVAALHHAFIKTENEELAQLLAPYVKQLEEEENVFSPSVWPPLSNEQLKMEKDQVVKIKDLNHPSFVHEYSSKDVYRMKNKKRGMVYIINNVEFSKSSNLSRRDGSDYDARNLYNLFNELQFDVKTEKNLTAREMIDFLRVEKEKVNWYEMECVILVIMSHGETTGIYGYDGHIAPLTKFTEVFNSDNCPGLNDKPRLVFVQACRGVNTETSHIGTGVQVSACSSDEGSSDLPGTVVTGNQTSVTSTGGSSNQTMSQINEGADTQSMEQSFAVEDSAENRIKNLDLNKSDDVLDAAPAKVIPLLPKTVHSAADFLIAYATPEGTKAFRNTEVGSWFLNAVVWIFKYHAHNTNIHDLMTKVNDLVAKARTLKGDLTVSKYENSFRKKFFFFPGVYGDPPKRVDED